MMHFLSLQLNHVSCEILCLDRLFANNDALMFSSNLNIILSPAYISNVPFSLCTLLVIMKSNHFFENVCIRGEKVKRDPLYLKIYNIFFQKTTGIQLHHDLP